MTTSATAPAAPSPQPYERLQAFVACHELSLAVYRITRSWVRTDGSGPFLAEEARSSVRAAPLRIMEGVELAPRGFRRCLDEAGGKLARLSAVLTLARDIGLLSAEQFTDLEIRRDHAERLTHGLWRAVGKQGARDDQQTRDGRRKAGGRGGRTQSDDMMPIAGVE